MPKSCSGLKFPMAICFSRQDGITYLFYSYPFANKFTVPKRGSILDTRILTDDPCAEIDYHSLTIDFLESHQSTRVEGKLPSAEYYNFFIGKDQTSWQSGVRSFRELIYEDVYPGIDFKFYSEKGTIKYDIEVSPGADPDNIQLRYTGADDLYIEEEELHVVTSVTEFTESRPLTYQRMTSGELSEVPNKYQLKNNVVQFKPDCYDGEAALVIDPALVFSTFSGSSGDNWGFTATFDPEGNTYSGGIVRLISGGTLPTTVGAYSESFNGGIWDVALLKYDSSGTNLLFGTYLGGSQNEFPHSLIINNAGDLLVLGSTGIN